MHFLLLTALPCIAVAHMRGVTSNTKFLDIAFLTETDVDETIAREANSSGSKLATLRSALETTYAALPKSDGHLTEQTVRYVLHRYFLNQHGWLIKGLEPQNTSWAHQTKQVQQDWSSWLPSYLQKKFQVQMQRGTELSALAEMVAVIEDLVHKEAELQLQEVYEAMGKDATMPLNRSAALEVIDMYALVFLVARNISVADPSKNRKRLLGFRRKYHGFAEMHRWLEGLVEEKLKMGQDVEFQRLKEVVWEVGDRYPEFNDQECHQLKHTLMGMEGGSRKPGRIPLVDFYNKSNHNHWRFTESPEYLRDLGALDEADPQRPHVLLANYLSSFNNCLRATSLYAVCCRNPCEGLLASLEKEVGGPYATPDQLAALVANLSTDTMPKRSGPEKLEAKLLERLRSIGSQVPLHGRLFAQWMHHAFPRECPYPHAAGTTNPQTPDEWMKAMGKSTSISEQQKQAIVEAYCPSVPEDQASKECGVETAELPWNDREELLEVNREHKISDKTSATPADEITTNEGQACFSWASLAKRIVPGLAILLGRRGLAKLRHGLVVGLLAWVGIAFEILDFRVVVASGLLYMLWQKATSPCIEIGEIRKTEKCEV
ncbi:unnamed protein product [Symbiodinium natans]|uniref:Uncharacterized protein n=1 Tax=Symbiodinium natans TaxID=878477 RepID=A0A812MG92_9DINO|nr:unnamed protein product [Symbiodinium natans]